MYGFRLRVAATAALAGLALCLCSRGAFAQDGDAGALVEEADAGAPPAAPPLAPVAPSPVEDAGTPADVAPVPPAATTAPAAPEEHVPGAHPPNAPDSPAGVYPGTGEHVEPDPEAAGIGYTREEGFRFRTADGAYVLRLSLQLGLKFEPTWREGEPELGSTFAFVRPILRGNFYEPWLGYRVSMELGRGDPFLLDAHVNITPWEALSFTFGQQGTPVSRHDSFGPQQIFFPDYAGVATYFWSGRERGLTVFGSVIDGRLDYYAGVYSGAPIDVPTNPRSNYLFEGRVTTSPFGRVNDTELPFTAKGEPLPPRVSFTLQGYTGKLQTSNESFNAANNVLTPEHSLLVRRNTTAGADLWIQGGPFIAFGEVYWSTERDDVTSRHSVYGAWGQVVANVYKNLFGAGGRFNWIDPNSNLSGDQALSVEGQLAWFIHPPELVLKLRYAWIRQRSPEPAELGFFQLPFAVGTTHLATAQLMLAF